MRQLITHSAQLRQTLVGRRKALKLTQQALAAKLGISQRRLSEIELAPGTLTIERLLELSNLLGLEIFIQDRQSNRSTKAEW